jgi:hypothetical protein
MGFYIKCIEGVTYILTDIEDIDGDEFRYRICKLFEMSKEEIDMPKTDYELSIVDIYNKAAFYEEKFGCNYHFLNKNITKNKL